MKKKTNISMLAACALLSGLCTVLLIIGGIIDILDLTSCAIASFAVIIGLYRFGYAAAFSIYFISCVLSFIFMPFRTSVIYFTAFIGYYPILKRFLESKIPKIPCTILKFLSFDAAMALIIYISIHFLSVQGFGELSGIYTAVIIIFANIFFIAYDIALSRIILVYNAKFRKILPSDRKN